MKTLVRKKQPHANALAIQALAINDRTQVRHIKRNAIYDGVVVARTPFIVRIAIKDDGEQKRIDISRKTGLGWGKDHFWKIEQPEVVNDISNTEEPAA